MVTSPRAAPRRRRRYRAATAWAERPPSITRRGGLPGDEGSGRRMGWAVAVMVAFSPGGVTGSSPQPDEHLFVGPEKQNVRSSSNGIERVFVRTHARCYLDGQQPATPE